MINSKKERILIYVAIFIVICIFIYVLYLIWSPMIKSSLYSDINKYDSTISYQNYMTDYYKDYISENLKITNFDLLYENLDENYIETIDQNGEKGNVRTFLLENNLISNDITIIDEKFYSSSNKNVYRYTYITHNMTKYINIIEFKPFEFVINFDQNNLSSIIDDNVVNSSRNNVDYKFEVIESTENSIRYKLSITNNSNDSYQFDFSNLNSLQILSNEKYANMALVANSSDSEFILNYGDSRSIEVLFNISLEDQMSVTAFKFNNVIINGSNSSVEIQV